MTTERERYDAAEDLTREVDRSPNQQMRGADLGQLYARRWPSLRDELSLARLLDRYADRLTVVDRQGQDLVWGLPRADAAPDLDALDELLLEEDPPLTIESSIDPHDVRLERARFVNYRILADAELTLAPLTVLVGPNGAGKSTLLDAMFRGSLLTTRKPLAVFRGRHELERVRRRDAGGAVEIELDGTGDYGFRFTTVGNDTTATFRFEVRAGGEPVDVPASLLQTPMGRCFGGAVLLRLDARQLARPTYAPVVVPYLRHDGLFLPSVLATLAIEDPDRRDQILASVREVVPSVHGIRTPRVPVQTPDGERIGNALEVKFGKTGWTPADQLSEGTLLTIGLHTLLSRAKPPKLLLLDDVDRGLHPNAQLALVQQLQLLADGGTQIVCTTHSPYILDPLTPDAVRVVHEARTGYAQVARLVDHPKWEQWKDEMTAGEFWQYAGDSWHVEAPVG